jgi:WD40 repeat protein
MVARVLAQLGLPGKTEQEEVRLTEKLNHNELAEALEQPDGQIRLQAIHSLSQMGKQAPLELLLLALGDEQSNIRAAAARALVNDPRSAALPALVTTLDDPSWVVRAEAARALGALPSQKTLESLYQATRDVDANVRSAALWAIGESGSAESLDFLRLALRDEEWLVREAAMLALEKRTSQILTESEHVHGSEQQPLSPDSSQKNFNQRDLPVYTVEANTSSKEQGSQQSEDITARLDRAGTGLAPSFMKWQPGRNGAHTTSTELSSSNHSPTFADWLAQLEAPEIAMSRNPQGQSGKHAKRSVQQHKSKHLKKFSGINLSTSWQQRMKRVSGGLLIASIIFTLILSWVSLTGSIGIGFFSHSNQTTPFTAYREHTSGVTRLAWSPTGTFIASADTKDVVRVWSAATGQTFDTYQHPILAEYQKKNATLLSLTWGSANTVLLAYSLPDHGIQVQQLDIDNQNSIPTLYQRSHLPSVPTAAAWANDHKTLAFDVGLGAIEIWNTLTRQLQNLCQIKSTTAFSHFAWDPDGSQLAVITQSHLLQVCSPKAGLLDLRYPSEQSANQLLWCTDENFQTGLIFLNPDGTIYLWLPSSSAAKPLLTPQQYAPTRSKNWSVTLLGLSPDNTQLYVGTASGTILIRDALTGNTVGSHQGHTKLVNTLAISPDGKTIASGGDDLTVQLWKIAQ